MRQIETSASSRNELSCELTLTRDTHCRESSCARNAVSTPLFAVMSVVLFDFGVRAGCRQHNITDNVNNWHKIDCDSQPKAGSICTSLPGIPIIAFIITVIITCIMTLIPVRRITCATGSELVITWVTGAGEISMFASVVCFPFAPPQVAIRPDLLFVS
ncbi:hypothetical protein RRG08_036051 [Elysia crispata]|uniref:Uncharacterized protein n=1 Tax=Elysia crispata TaxID=231223 RepID=A0AAE1ALB0_9GAST|nr:hypothetical protein RRG08_036051 [Elysia crispata]